MENPNTKSAQKFVKNGNSQSAVPSIARGVVIYIPGQQAIKNQSWVSQKSTAKENTKPQEIKLHTQQRALQRAIFNYSVEAKLYLIEQRKKHIEIEGAEDDSGGRDSDAEKGNDS